jgi:hypothetical protein
MFSLIVDIIEILDTKTMVDLIEIYDLKEMFNPQGRIFYDSWKDCELGSYWKVVCIGFVL